MFDPSCRAVLCAALLAVALVPGVAAAEFPEISDFEKDLTEVPDEPSASAVVLFEKALVKLRDYRRERSSRMDVQVRVKVLSEEGMERFGEVLIAHSRWQRLHDFVGRTVLPDGRVVPVGDDSVFRDTTSRSESYFLTKVAFPAVEVGSILDYRYTLNWDSPWYLHTWHFAGDVPKLYSEIAYLVPKTLAANPWLKEVAADVEITREKQVQGTLLRAISRNVPAIPDEPDSFPRSDLSSRFMLVPTYVGSRGSRTELMASWEGVCDVIEDGYVVQRRSRGKVRRQADELVAGLRDAGEKVLVLYRFVRDEVQTEPSHGIAIYASRRDDSLDRNLTDRRGTRTEKSLMLIEMLDSVGIEAQLLWAANRFDGRIDAGLPNPNWFDRPLVRVEVAGEPIVLDPSDRRLGFGQLAPGFEGMPVLVYRLRNPELAVLPLTSPEDHQRAARLDLAVDGDGRIAGRGELRFTGHHAWRARFREDDDEWEDWLERRFPGYDVSAIEVADERDGRSVEVSWSLAQRDEEVLGDEVSLAPSRPFGPLTQRYTLPPDRRLTPVQLDFADVDRLDMTLTWPEGWVVEVVPQAVSASSEAGAVEVRVEVDKGGREMRYRRLLRLGHVEYLAGPPYAALRQTMAAMEASDAQDVVLVAE